MRRFVPAAIAAAACVTVLLSAATNGWAASPSLGAIQPRGIQRGAESVLTFSGGRLGDALEIFFYSPGFEVTKIESKDANSAAVTIKVGADCRLGEHVAQVRTPSGISEYRTFYVGALPIVDEKEPNTDFEAPQAISPNVTVHGVVQNEDVDYYVIDAKKGQRIAAEVEGMRLGNTMFDPYIAIMDAKRFELAAADDSPLVLQDAVASIIAPEDGKYIIQVRESSYGGSGSCQYRLHVGNFPRPTAVYPAGGKLGEVTEIRYLGDAGGEIAAQVQAPSEIVPGFGVLASDDTGVASSENVFRLFEHGNVLEVEPNNELNAGTPAELPLAFNGIIAEPGDIDCFKFQAKKGQVWEVDCFARRIRSALDPVMNLYYADGRGIAGDDDARKPDSYFRFTVPEDGEYVIRVTDHLARGGIDFVYRIEFAPVKPKLTVGIPRVARYSQYRQQIFVPRGNRFATLMSVGRSNFGGDVIFEPKDLPAGITMTADTVPAGLGVVPVLFEAAADAPLSGKLINFHTRHADANTNISGGFFNRADYVISAPGQSLYRWRDVTKLAIAVVDEVPFHLEIVQPKVPLVRNGSMQLKIVAHRKEGFTKAIGIQLPFRPPGVGAASSVNIPEGQNEVLYPINANSGAGIATWKILVLGSSDVNGAAWVSSQLANLEIAAPMVQFAMERAAVEQGKETEVFCKVQVDKPFEGTAKVELLGLPAKVTTTEMQLNKDLKELSFKVNTDPTSPAGNHKNVFCRVTITVNGEPIEHSRVGGTELRIDKPLPPPPNAKPMPKAEPKPAAKKEEPKKPEKRLTRLEKLRLEAKKRAEGG